MHISNIWLLLVFLGPMLSAPVSAKAEPENGGETFYAENCAPCHGERGVRQVLRQKSPKARKRALASSHLRYHLPDETARAALVDYLLLQLRN